MYKKIALIGISSLLTLVLTSASCTAVTSVEKTSGKKNAPDFTLRSLEGTETTLSQFKGEKYVLMVFGATWCPYCVQEIPELKSIYKEYADGNVKLLYINIQESEQKLRSFVKKHGIPYTVLLDTKGEVAGLYNVRGIPHQVIVDKNGHIVYEGPHPSGGLLPLLKKLSN